MELYQAIEKRCSVRKFQDKAVETEKLHRVLDAGRIAPSANNRQDWKFIVVRDPAIRAKLVQAAEQAWMQAAPIIIAVVGTNDRIMFCEIPAAPVDCAIAIDHMTLAAVEEGLGTCWIGHFKQDECKKILGVPDPAKIVQMLTLGYPAVADPKEKSRKDFDDVVCFDKFTE